jgi:hypothetical protein
MKWGIYARNGFEGAEAFRQGVLGAGCTAHVCSVSDYGAGQIEGYDAVAVFGLQWRGAWVLRDYMQAGIPVFVIDYGYLKRTNHIHDWRTGHWQVSYGGLNNIPDYDDPIRFEALGLEIKERGGDPDGYTLLCVQTTGDASHGKDEEQLRQWAEEQARQYPNLVIRPHPLQEHLTYGLPICQAKTLDEALAGASLVVTGNSNTGHEALMAGVPVVATFPGAAWEKLSGPILPTPFQRKKHFQRAAWGQWTWQEMQESVTHRFLMKHYF